MHMHMRYTMRMPDTRAVLAIFCTSASCAFSMATLFDEGVAFFFRIDTELAVASDVFLVAPMLGSSEPRRQSGAVKEKKTHGVLT